MTGCHLLRPGHACPRQSKGQHDPLHHLHGSMCKVGISCEKPERFGPKLTCLHRKPTDTPNHSTWSPVDAANSGGVCYLYHTQSHRACFAHVSHLDVLAAPKPKSLDLVSNVCRFVADEQPGHAAAVELELLGSTWTGSKLQPSLRLLSSEVP